MQYLTRRSSLESGLAARQLPFLDWWREGNEKCSNIPSMVTVKGSHPVWCCHVTVFTFSFLIAQNHFKDIHHS